MRRTTPIAACSLASLLAACAGPLNQGDTIGDRVELSTFTPAPQSTEPDAPVVLKPGPSLAGIERGNWHETSFLVPLDGTEHQANDRADPDFANGLARQRGEFPTQATVLETDAPYNRRAQAFEAIAAPVYAGLDILLSPFKAVANPPWQVVESPREAYERAPVPSATPVHPNPRSASVPINAANPARVQQGQGNP